MPVHQKSGQTYVLGTAQNAEPGRCGSCAFFSRRTDRERDSGGDCRFQPPPQFAMRWHLPSKKVEEDECYPSYTNDTDTCDLYRSSGSRYVKQINWSVP